MNLQPESMIHLRDLPGIEDFHVGSLQISPARRLIEGPGGTRSLQPQVMAVLVCLARNVDRVATRQMLFDMCWGRVAVGDDSLNRTLSAIRQSLKMVGVEDLSIETIPRTGYRLAVKPQAFSKPQPGTAPVNAAFDCWRAGLPKPDIQEIGSLENALSETPGDARSWGILALLLRKAAEYASVDECASFVARCEQAARNALDLNPNEPNALVALTGLVPLFGNWTKARENLLGVLAIAPNNAPARHDLAVLEMATGRPSAAAPLIADLLAEDGLAAAFHYKRMYHLWTLGDISGAELAATRAVQLWPRHPAIWAARYWTLVFTERATHAVQMLQDEQCPPNIPKPMIELLRATATISGRNFGDRKGGYAGKRSQHVVRCVEVSALGPAHAVSALLSLLALDAIDEAFEVARGYYMGHGRFPAPLRWNPNDPSITDQHRRVTQPLFLPAAARMREDPRFVPLCEQVGLAAYWDHFDLTPDFLRTS